MVFRVQQILEPAQRVVGDSYGLPVVSRGSHYRARIEQPDRLIHHLQAFDLVEKARLKLLLEAVNGVVGDGDIEQMLTEDRGGRCLDNVQLRPVEVAFFAWAVDGQKGVLAAKTASYDFSAMAWHWGSRYRSIMLLPDPLDPQMKVCRLLLDGFEACIL